MLEENHELEKIVEDGKQYRWYSVLICTWLRS